MIHLSIKISVLLLLSITIQSVAQISSNAFSSEQTQYQGNSPNDPIFFYNDMSGAILTAPNGINYQWYTYSTSSNTFEPISGATNSNLNNIIENGYRVEVEDADGLRTNYYCWNFIPDPQIDSIGVPNTTDPCHNLRLTAYTKSKLLRYYDHLSDHSSIDVDYGYTWSSTPFGDISEASDYTALIDAPFEDTEYSIEHGGKFAPNIPSVSATKIYEAVAVEAKFIHEIEGTPDNEANEGSAPLVVRYTAQSSEGEAVSQGKISDWEWTFGDAGKDFVPNPIFTFQDFGEYPVVLQVQNIDSGCQSETDPEVFKVNVMVVKAPNAFTPFSSPGENDEFRVLYRSVNKFTMLVYNRWGRKVYQSSDPAAGWNGKIGNQNAEPGVYFYRIEAEGFNRDEHIELEGAIHLIVN